jgi:hypothetical protein
MQRFNTQQIQSFLNSIGYKRRPVVTADIVRTASYRKQIPKDFYHIVTPEMFGDFVVPYLQRSVEYLDYSMFHVDGHQCLAHVDLLLQIEGLNAIEWTPDPQVPPGGSSHWYDLYKKILNAGKVVWVTNLDADEVISLLDAGGKKIQAADMRQLAKAVEAYR